MLSYAANTHRLALPSKQVKVRIVEQEGIVQNGDRNSGASTRAVGIEGERVVRRVVPENFRRRCRSSRIGDEMRCIERAGIRATDSQTIAECLMIEIEHVVLAAMPAEVGDVIKSAAACSIDKMVSAQSPGQRVGSRLAFEKVVAAIA